MDKVVRKHHLVASLLLLVVATTSAAADTSEAVPGASCGGRIPTIVGTDGNDEVIGTFGNDVILGGGGDDAIDAGFGHDLVCGGAGHDRINGGVGNDRIFGDDDDDTLAGEADDDHVSGGAGHDQLEGGSEHDLLWPGAGVDLVDGGEGRDTASFRDATTAVAVDLSYGTATGDGVDVLDDVEGVEGSSFSDSIVGDEYANQLSGGEGNDVISGDKGRDTLDGGEGSDGLGGGAGADIVSFASANRGVAADLANQRSSGAGSDHWSGIEHALGSRFDDLLVGSDRSNRLLGGDGDDRLRGADGADLLMGGRGDDDLIGGRGRDGAVFVEARRAVYVSLRKGWASGHGRDSLHGVEVLSGSPVDGDRLYGDRSSNFLAGGAGRDRLSGGGGHDFLDGGVMRDHVDGGSGRDLCEETGEDRLLSCEEKTHADAPPEALITWPRLEQRIKPYDFSRLRGRLLRAARGKVEVGLRMQTPTGCKWWSRDRFVRGSCSEPVWSEVTGEGSWSLSVDSDRLQATRYLALARAVVSGGSHESPELGRNRIAFRVTSDQ